MYTGGILGDSIKLAESVLGVFSSLFIAYSVDSKTFVIQHLYNLIDVHCYAIKLVLISLR